MIITQNITTNIIITDNQVSLFDLLFSSFLSLISAVVAPIDETNVLVCACKSDIVGKCDGCKVETLGTIKLLESLMVPLKVQWLELVQLDIDSALLLDSMFVLKDTMYQIL